ncbi:transporter YfdV [Phocaeicola barnesiae]|uniref:transporter YfdV n=1 Tax=Phocaeicola barnesiae TaxID=376804 RepID=UPI00035D5D1B|nr:transporter YfdV [Phocaeicola barnesiae]HJG78588.1 transporter YfdV [Phocaeicola barnesiae]
MWNIILTCLVPIFVVMALGYAAGKTNAFTGENARILNKLVLNYALPAALFLSIVKADREMLFADLQLTLVSTLVILAVFLWSYFGCYKFFRHTRKEAAVCALIAGSPTIGFLGFAVLDPMFGATTTTGLVVAIVAIVVNAITIPIGLWLLNPAADGSATAGQKPSNAFVSAIRQPVVWAPVLAVIFVLTGIRIPAELDPSFELIAKANSGVAVFAAGLTLSAQKFVFDKEIWYNTFVKLLLMPGALLLVGLLVGIEGEKLQMLVMAGALPPAFSGIIIGSRYQTYVRVGTSSLAISTFLFMLSAPFWIWITRLVAP